MKSLLLYSWGTTFCDFYIFISKCILTEILSLAKNDIDRDISLGENDIDRDISLGENDIDREGQQQDKSKIKYFLFTKPLSASAEIPSL